MSLHLTLLRLATCLQQTMQLAFMPNQQHSDSTALNVHHCRINAVLPNTAHCASGNSGGPAFADLQHAKVAGVAFSKLSNADNVGYIIPYQIIKHFLQVCVCFLWNELS